MYIIQADDMNKKNEIDIFSIIRQGSFQKFLKLYNKTNINTINEFKQSMLHEACGFNNIEVCYFLLKEGINLNSQDINGDTALHISLSNSNNQLVKLLLSKKVNLVIENNYGNQALWTALLNKDSSMSILEELLIKGSNPLHRNKSGVSPYDMVKKLNIPELSDLFNLYISKSPIPLS